MSSVFNNRINPEQERSETVVLLGASNLSLGIRSIIQVLLCTTDKHLDLYLAAGHGRSYGVKSRVFGRTLPAIRKCGLWSRLEEEKADQEVHVLVSDVGNDLLYGHSPEKLVAWIEECLAKLKGWKTSITIVLPPVDSAERLSAWHYHTARFVLFPKHPPISFPEMKKRVRETTSRLGELANKKEALVVEQQRDWYGLDPIHIGRKYRTQVWKDIFSLWPAFSGSEIQGRSELPKLFLKAAECEFLGIPRETKQPYFEASERLRLYLY